LGAAHVSCGGGTRLDPRRQIIDRGRHLARQQRGLAPLEKAAAKERQKAGLKRGNQSPVGGPRQLFVWEGQCEHTRAGYRAPMKYPPDNDDYQRDRNRQRHERDLNAEAGNGHRPSLRRKVIIGIILGSFFYLIVSCYYWIGGDVPKIDRAKFKFNHTDKQ